MFRSEQHKAGDDFGPVSAVLDSNLIHDGRLVQMEDILSIAISYRNESRCQQGSCDFIKL